MAYNNGLLNFGDSYVEVGYDNEDYSVNKAQIVEKDGTVHELGGGGGDFNNAVVKIVSTASNAVTVEFNDFIDGNGELTGALNDDGVYHVTNFDAQVVSIPANSQKDFDVMIVEGCDFHVYATNLQAGHLTAEGSAEILTDDGEYARVWGNCTITIS